MSDIVIVPRHIQLAKAALAENGISIEEGSKALQLAAVFYNNTPQVSKTDTMREQRNQAQDELERVSEQLLAERKKVTKLREELALVGGGMPELRQKLHDEADARAGKQVGEMMSALHTAKQLFYDLAEILNDTHNSPELRLRRIRRMLTTVLAGNTNRKHRLLAEKLRALDANDPGNE